MSHHERARDNGTGGERDGRVREDVERRRGIDVSVFAKQRSSHQGPSASLALKERKTLSWYMSAAKEGRPYICIFRASSFDSATRLTSSSS